MTEFDRPDNSMHGGDKLAFVIPNSAKNTDFGKKAAAVIAAQRAKKQGVKKQLEKWKEDQLRPHDKVEQAFRHMRRALMDSGVTADAPINKIITEHATQPNPKLHRIHMPDGPLRTKFLQAYDKLLPAEKKLMKDLSGKSEKEREAKRKEILREYDRQVGLKAGWSLVELTDELQKKGLICDTVPNGNSNRRFDYFGPSQDGRSTEVYLRIYTGTERYRPSDEDSTLLRARGSRTTGADGRKVENERKQYVRDGNGVVTRRFVTRAISFYHLANMCGMKFDGKLWVSDDMLAGHGPRAAAHTLRSQGRVFDVESGAHVVPANHTGGPGSQAMPGPPGSVSGARGAGVNDLDAHMTPNQRASMQVRDGSGPGQQMVSGSTVGRDSGKIIRGNKGERFDLGPETVAMIEVDLSVLLKDQIAVLNQHSFDSHQYKVAFDRYTSATDRTIKRKALDELSEYVYSAQKNREVVMDRIPNNAVTRIHLKGRAKWDYVGGAPVPTGTWHPWKDVEGKLKEFVKDTKKLVALQDRAKPKMEDRNSRT